MKLIFFGTSEFSVIVFEKLLMNDMKPDLVVTAPDQPVGRGHALTAPPMKIYAEQHQVAVLQPRKVEESMPEIVSLKPDILITASYGQILPWELLKVPKRGALNVHPSLLPKYRGPSPVQTTLLNGDSETGVTIILMDEEVDHGPILAQEKLSGFISSLTYPSVKRKLAMLGGDVLVRTISPWMRGVITPKDQDDDKATYTKKIEKRDGKINWNERAVHIERQVRAFTPWPGTFAYWKESLLKVLGVEILHRNPDLVFEKPGVVFRTLEGYLAVQTGEDALILKQLQLAGRRPMSSRELLLGHAAIIGAQLA